MMTASTVLAAMPMRMAPRTCRAIRTAISNRPTTNTSVGQPRRPPSAPSCSGVPLPARTKPASTKPISAMNSPIPAAIAFFSGAGMARKTAVRKPVSTSAVMTSPSITTMPIAAGHDIREATWKATKALRPRPVARANG